MIVRDVRLEPVNGTNRLSAVVRWEDVDRPEQEIWLQCDSDCVLMSPTAVALATFPPAIRAGERRLKMDVAAAPEFLDGLEEAIAWFLSWSPRREHGHTA